VDELMRVLRRYPRVQASFGSFQHEELRQIRKELPDAQTYAFDHFKPIEIIQHARSVGATGVGLNKWLMNPLTYHLAKRYHLRFYLYTVNSPWLAKFIHRLYPNIDFCTDYPLRLRAILAKRRNTDDML
jgi:hypothetical protein